MDFVEKAHKGSSLSIRLYFFVCSTWMQLTRLTRLLPDERLPALAARWQRAQRAP